MPGVDVRMVNYGDRIPVQERYNSEESLEDNHSTTSSTESRQSDFSKKDNEFIPTRSSGILSSRPAANPGQFTKVNSNPLLISAQKQMHLVEEVKKKKIEIKIGEDTPDWQSNLDGWKQRRRKQSEETVGRLSEMKKIEDLEFENGGRRKSSLGKKISLQILNDDEIDFDGLDSSSGDFSSENVATPSTQSKEEVQDQKHQSLSKTSFNNSISPRRESRGISQEKAIPEEPELEEETSPVETEKEETNPYESAIEGYKSFAKSQLISSEKKSESSSKSVSSFVKTSIPSSKESSITRSASTSSLSPSPNTLLSTVKKNQHKKDIEDEWEDKIETFVQPARKPSTEISDKMKIKLASFQEQQKQATKEVTPTRTIKPDNKFKDKLNAFKNIEETSNIAKITTRRESEPAIRPKGLPLYKSSSSSSFMNTLQNNKFFQENSLGSEQDDEHEDNQLLEDALEESFNVLEDDKEEKSEQLVFSADDFIPIADKKAPPQEKPPPLPSVPPPPLPVLDTEDDIENEIDKQEREIIESLEREENEKMNYLESITPDSTEDLQPNSFNSVISSTQSEDFIQSNHIITSSHTTVSTQSNKTTNWVEQQTEHLMNGDHYMVGGKQEQSTDATIQTRKKDKNDLKSDYNSHWLIQEAEQRRISEAKHKQNLNIQQISPSSSNGSHGMVEKIENINNNNNENSNQYLEKRTHLVSENIYANVDPANLNYNHSHSAPYVPEPGSHIPQLPGPQVPPRPPPTGHAGDGSQDRVLSVSGKKKCSHCKEELGRGAAMIIESLRLFYHIRCFKCCVCSIQLGNGEQGTDVRVRNNRLHCQNCYSNDEGLKFSKV